MAAAELLHSRLPNPWNYGVTQDGRIFFINDESKSTTWLHPVYNHPIQSGHLSRQDLPKGWELAFTREGIPYYVDHTNLRTSFIHPVTGESALPVHEERTSGDNYLGDQRNFKRSSLRRSSKKQKVIDKAPEPKRSGDAPVTLKGWLYKQDSGGLRSWKKRWFVLSDFCLYYYKDQTESQFQGSILLPSYEIGFCNKSDGVNRKYSFKAQHQNMRTYYFATDNSEDQSRWMNALKLATQLKNNPVGEFKENYSSQYQPDQGQGHDHSYSQDSGGFSEPRSPQSALDHPSPRSRDSALRSSADDPAWYQNSPQSADKHQDMASDMYARDNYQYDADPRMRPGQGMRNTYVTREPVHHDARLQQDGSSQHPRLSSPSNVGGYVGHPQYSYHVVESESLSSRGSRGGLPRDHNYNVPKGQYHGRASQNDVYNPQQDTNALEQSTDSVERTLDRSFDSIEVLPGYDSFAESHLQPSGQYQERHYQQQQQPQQQQPRQQQQQQQQQLELNSNTPSTGQNSSIVEVQRQNSLLRLQQWTRTQQDALSGHRLSGHSNSGEPRVLDGSGKHGQDRFCNQVEEDVGFHGSRASDHHSPSSHPSPNVDAEVGRPAGPGAAPTRGSDDRPARPPIPAAYREQYIRELAETKTPHTRHDLLTSIEIQRVKQQQPLVFQYPEVSPPSFQNSRPQSNPQPTPESAPHRHMQNAVGPSIHGSVQLPSQTAGQLQTWDPVSRYEPNSSSNPDPGLSQSVVQHQERIQHEQRQQRESGLNSMDLSNKATVVKEISENSLDPSKSWDDLNDLDPDEAQFKYNSRIDQLLAEKRRIMGETAELLRSVPSSTYSEESHGSLKGGPNQERDGFNRDGFCAKGYDAYESFSREQQGYQNQELAQKGRSGDNVYENMGLYAAVNSSNKPWPYQKYPSRDSLRLESSGNNRAGHHPADPEQRLGSARANHSPRLCDVGQSEADLTQRKPPWAGKDQPPGKPQSESCDDGDLSRSLGRLHIDVGEWPEGGQFPSRSVDQRPPEPRWPQHEPLLGKMARNSGTTMDEDRERHQNGDGRYFDGQPPITEFQRHGIETIKEDPNMSDQDIFTTKTLADLQRHLSGHRLRLSISAGDLIGKSHEELVLLLIQLRRDQSRLERARDYYRAKLDVHRPQEKDYKLKRKNSVGRLHDVVEKEHDQYMELRKIYDELENQLEVSKPLVNLLDNMVRMGSLYGGNNLMLASQYKQHKLRPGEYMPPKKMITFSRQYQEQKLSQLQEAELKQLMEDEVDLEEKLQQLYQLDRELQERSLAVTNLQENKDLLENTVSELRKDLQMTNDPHTIQNIKYQIRHLEAELVTVRQQLADSSKLLEETSAEDARVENEVMLLRKRIYGLNRTHSTPSLTNESVRAKQQLEQELEGVQNVMNNLSKQGAVLSDTIKALRHSTPDLTALENTSKSKTTYLETDLDTGRTRDLAKETVLSQSDSVYTKSPYGVRTNEEHIYASVKKVKKVDGQLEGRDRSKSEPPMVQRGDPWQHGIEATEVKTRVESTRSSLQARDLAQRNSSVYRGSYQSLSGHSENTREGVIREALQGSPGEQLGSPGSVKSVGYDESQQRDAYNGIYRAEMKVVTPETADYRGYPRADMDPYAHPTGDTADVLHQQSQRYDNQELNKQTYTPVWSVQEQHLSAKPMSEVRPQQQQPQPPQQQQQQQQQHGQNGERRMSDKQFYGAAISADSPVYEPIELSQADENTKKFFGILPKDVGRSQTVREVKKEAERRSRERKRFYVNVHGSLDLQQAEMMSEEFQRTQSLPHKTSAPSLLTQSGRSQDDSTLLRRKSVGIYKPKQQVKAEQNLSATDRLFPKQPSGGQSFNPNSKDSVRRMSDIFSPRPFTSSTAGQKASQPTLRSFGSSQSYQGNTATVATVRPVVNNSEYQRRNGDAESGTRSWSTDDVTKDEARRQEYRKKRLKNRHNPRGRFMTISSTEPIRMEAGHGWRPSKHQSAAGDLISGHWHDVPDYVRSEPLKDFQFDSETIDREVLYVPEKVKIPDRYVPDSDDEETEEDRERRLVKGEQIKRMLAAQSLAEWRQEEVGFGPSSGPIHKQVEAERKRREHILDLKQALAVQVTERSKQVAGSSKSTAQ